MTRVVIQSRLSSTRLPGKAMLQLAGMPKIELVARRAARAGHDVVVATSSPTHDDRIARCVERLGIRVVRGSLPDVPGRFEAACADLHPTDREVRLTSDNPVVDELLEATQRSGHQYGCVDIEQVPEGLGAEATSAFDREPPPHGCSVSSASCSSRPRGLRPTWWLTAPRSTPSRTKPRSTDEQGVVR